jgi:2-polyprenyl-6-methoxyphenol hydroxylase-like FAD-dependent oxidoreductase
MRKAAIIGSGFADRAWAISFSRAGHDVALWDQDRQATEKALTYIRGLLPDLGAFDLLNGVAAQVPKSSRPRGLTPRRSSAPLRCCARAGRAPRGLPEPRFAG